MSLTGCPMVTDDLEFRVDEARCNQCGLCASDCLARIISLERTGFPEVQPDQQSSCIDCQHCFALCPEGALSIRGLDPAASRPLGPGAFPSFEQMGLLVRGRRSVRQYRDENVDPALIRRLLEDLEYAPTGVNCRKLTFTVIQDKAVLAELRARVMSAFTLALEENRLPGPAGYLSAMIGLWRDQGRDVVFRGAPHLLVVSAPPDSPTPQQDVPLTLAYFELLAQSSGLGTLWLGLLRRALELSPDLKGLLGLPADHCYYAMLFGYPAVRYQRTVQRGRGAKVQVIEAIPSSALPVGV